MSKTQLATFFMVATAILSQIFKINISPWMFTTLLCCWITSDS